MDISMISNNKLIQNTTSKSKKVKINVKSENDNNSSNMDTVEFSSKENEYLLCENYSNINTYSKIDISKIQYSCSMNIESIATETMNKYYNGDISEDELQDSFENCCVLYLDMLDQTGVDSSTDSSKEAAVMRVFTSFQKMNCVYSIFDCETVAKKIASSYGYSGEGRDDFVYYDSDIYYKNKNIEKTLTNIVQSSFSNYGLTDLDAQAKVIEREQNNHLYGGLTFNSHWATMAEYGVNVCNMTSLDEEPPEGFKFFYKQNQTSSIADRNGNITLDSQKGILIVWSGKEMQKIDVPFNNSTDLGELAGFFNAGELYNQTAGINPSLMGFINNFNIYTRTYSFLKFSI